MTNAERLIYEKALAYATEKHKGQFRLGGQPYITHPVAVAQHICTKGFGLDYQLTALFHDLLEDTDATEQEIEALSNPEVLTAVKLLTKADDYKMNEYILNIKANRIAFAVKAADRFHNLQCAVCTDEEFKRRYILETIDWYLDFSSEISVAVKELAQTLNNPISKISFLYEPNETWKIN